MQFENGFPFPPYGIQKQFMEALHGNIDRNEIGILESPTGTGKSLSIICGSLSWLVKEKSKAMDLDKEEDGVLPDWIDEEYQKIKENEKVGKKRKHNDGNLREKEQSKRRKKVSTEQIISNLLEFEEDREFLLGNDGEGQKEKGMSGVLHDLYSKELEFREKKEVFCTPKIIYCTRTHSQINQFIKEIKKTKYRNEVKVISIISRKFFCMNEKIQRLKSMKLMNEKCIDTKSTECPYYAHKNFRMYSNSISTKLRDIEELVSFGKKLEICPYYGVRLCVNGSDMILLPYSTLIHKSTRESIGLKSLKDCVVIVDEAHNLIDSIVGVNSCEISERQLELSLGQLHKYLSRYMRRLKRSNLTKLKQLIGILKKILNHLKSQTASRVLQLNEFLFSTELDNVNLFDFEKFILKMDLARKLNGFLEKYVEDENNNGKNVIYPVRAFLMALTNVQRDCKLFIKVSPERKSMKFLLLNPSVYFKTIVEEARSVILTGGTMEPISHVQKQLFPNEEFARRIRVSKFPHIIPKENLYTCALSFHGKQKMNFTFQNRNNVQMLHELGKFLSKLSFVVPDGIVCFFVSYAYENFVNTFLKREGYLRNIQKNKKFFREPKNSKDVKEVLQKYKRIIDENYPKNGFYFKGSFLSCVVGGKMSEGINFSDGYGRCIVIIGLPFPNVNDLELKEKIAFQKKKFGEKEGHNYVVDLCMTKVNQSIGRSIRHINDYSSIVLLDERYKRSNILQKIPTWISSGMSHDEMNFGRDITNFFEGKKRLQMDIERQRKRHFENRI